ncbi:MAG: hypothetical protein EZS28_029110 [Streblomastix strix]|uniref:Integrase catalytic domain-containing protein n=1 Tax=Streblomastix strix TaxID=222440 RepID=A0A5J4UYT8_9EUKA|nr:MAG: hypothetical protein EZS28_029110 [Streblomastix strix]
MPLTKPQCPYFSPKLGSWEIGLVFDVNPVTRRRWHYLFAININTKYLVVIPLIVDEKNATFILAALKKLINQHNRVVDSVIRTIRNGFGQDLQGFASPTTFDTTSSENYHNQRTGFTLNQRDN